MDSPNGYTTELEGLIIAANYMSTCHRQIFLLAALTKVCTQHKRR